MDAMIPPSLAFRQERESTWRELEKLVTKVENRSLKALDAHELGRLPLLYRSTLASLAVARSMCLNRNLLAYLENLCARAYTCMNAPQRRIREAVAAFVQTRFPRVVRQYAWHVLVSALIFILGAGTGYVITSQDQERFYNFVGEEYAQGRTPDASTEDLRAVLYGGEAGANTDQLAAFSSFLLSNNARVGMMAFALGFAFGIPVIYLLFTNGMLLGAFGALYSNRGLGWDFWGWVLPHGVTEIFAVILCGAGGLALAQALIFPRRMTRLQSIARTGRDAGAIVLGAVGLFFIAALIEGFFRQLVNDITIRYTLVGLTTLVWFAYFTLGGRKKNGATHTRPSGDHPPTDGSLPAATGGAT